MSRRRQLLLAGVVLALIAANDFVSRIHVGHDETLRQFAAPAAKPVPPAADIGMVRAQLAEWLPELTTGPKPADSDDPAAFDLKLAGIFEKQGRKFAVMLAVPKSGGPPERRQLAVGEELKGLRLKDIGRGVVTLEGPDGSRELKLFARAGGR
jgi:hypothetical protein